MQARITESERTRQAERIAGVMRAECAKLWGRSLRALVLTGSMARDEATFRRSGEGWAVAGDAEFLAAFRDGARLPPAAAVRDICTAAEQRLIREGVRCAVDLGVVKGHFFRSLRPSMFAHELRECGRVIWGDGEILGLIPKFGAAEVPPEDGFRTLCNRIVEQAGAMARGGESAIHYSAIKLYLDMASSLLVFLGCYEPGYRSRSRRLLELCGSSGPAWPFPRERFARKVEECTAWKTGTEPPGENATEAFLGEAVEYAHRLWRWELRQLTGSAEEAGDGELWAAWSRMQRKHGARGWLYALRRRGWHRSWRLWPHWARLACGGSPRLWIYGTGAGLLFGLEEEKGMDWRELGARLPVPSRCGDWRELGAAISANYREFVVGTRS